MSNYSKETNINPIVKILMSRDGLTREEAEQQLRYVREMINDAVADGGYDEVEDIMYSELGLEMDYIHDIL